MFLSAQLSNYSDHLTFQYAAVGLRHVNRRLFFFPPLFRWKYKSHVVFQRL